MRRLLILDCAGATLGATLDGGDASTALLMVTGGSQTRIGSHRMYERLAAALAGDGITCLRFDRRGVGDSSGTDPGFRGSLPDLKAAAGALVREAPSARRYGFGLCDGATALALFGGELGLNGLILVNPWLVEAEPDAPPPAAIRRHYRERLTSWAGWKEIFSGKVSYRKLFKGVIKIGSPHRDSSLAADAAVGLSWASLPAEIILARGDATAIAAGEEIKGNAFKSISLTVQIIETTSHTFARPGDEERLLAVVTDALRRLESVQAS